MVDRSERSPSVEGSAQEEGMEVALGNAGFQFCSRFDSGNLRKVELTEETGTSVCRSALHIQPCLCAVRGGLAAWFARWAGSDGAPKRGRVANGQPARSSLG